MERGLLYAPRTCLGIVVAQVLRVRSGSEALRCGIANAKESQAAVVVSRSKTAVAGRAPLNVQHRAVLLKRVPGASLDGVAQPLVVNPRESNAVVVAHVRRAHNGSRQEGTEAVHARKRLAGKGGGSSCLCPRGGQWRIGPNQIDDLRGPLRAQRRVGGGPLHCRSSLAIAIVSGRLEAADAAKRPP